MLVLVDLAQTWNYWCRTGSAHHHGMLSCAISCHCRIQNTAAGVGRAAPMGWRLSAGRRPSREASTRCSAFRVCTADSRKASNQHAMLTCREPLSCMVHGGACYISSHALSNWC